MKESINAVAYTHIGYKRERNDDAFFINYTWKFFGVCDGIGGIKYGKKTAELAADYFNGNVFEFEGEEKDLDLPPDQLLKKVIDRLDQLIGLKNYEWYVRYGCTLCGIWIVDKAHAFVFNLGDSRCYVYRKNEKVLEKLTEDHNMAEAILKKERSAGDMELRQARHILTKYIGNLYDNEPEIISIDYQMGDRFLICTDGLYSEVSEKELYNIMYNYEHKEISKVGDLFIQRALESGGNDNITLVIIEIDTKE